MVRLSSATRIRRPACGEDNKFSGFTVWAVVWAEYFLSSSRFLSSSCLRKKSSGSPQELPAGGWAAFLANLMTKNMIAMMTNTSVLMAGAPV